MNSELKILLNDNNNLYLYWDPVTGVDNYTIIGLNKTFNKERIKSTKNNFIILKLQDIKNYIKLGILFNKNDDNGKENIFGETNMVDIKIVELNTIKIKSIQSYKGITLSFRDESLYDKYILYEKKSTGLKLLLETEDWQVTSKDIKEGKEYYVEGYTIKDDSYELKGISPLYTCKPEIIKKRTDSVLTVVIPIYNGETFLSRCIDSILLSTLEKINIVLVNDGSTDNTKKIIDWYQEEYKGTIKAFTQENKGVSFARNKGIEMVDTPFIAFIDCDDIVHPFMYQKLYDFAMENRLDTVIAKTIIRKEYGKYEFCLNLKNDNNIVYSFDKMAEELEKRSFENIFFHSSCNKIMKTEIVKKHPFPDYNEYEDIAFTMNAYSYIDFFGFVPTAYYVWDQRFRQIMSTLSTRYFEHDSKLNIHKGYCDSSFYCYYHGNPKRKNYLLYHSIKMIYSYLKDKKIDLSNNIYVKEILKISTETNLLLNTYVLKDKELYIYLFNLLKKSK